MKKLTFKQLTKGFNYVNSDIEANFPLEKVGKVEYKLWHPDKYISTENALREIEIMGYKPATLSHLLDWKDWNGTDVVVGLGSVANVDGNRLCPYLDSDSSGRGLDLYWIGSVWVALCRFLLVRNLDSETKCLDSGTLSLGNLGTRVKILEDKLEAISKILK